jgi:hypothetical protein
MSLFSFNLRARCRAVSSVGGDKNGTVMLEEWEQGLDTSKKKGEGWRPLAIRNEGQGREETKTGYHGTSILRRRVSERHSNSECGVMVGLTTTTTAYCKRAMHKEERIAKGTGAATRQALATRPWINAWGADTKTMRLKVEGNDTDLEQEIAHDWHQEQRQAFLGYCLSF